MKKDHNFLADNIVLIGMPGSGKSTVGVLLAKALACSFIDTDLLVQQKEGMTLKDIIVHEGLSSFLDIESDVILSMKPVKSVIATGGSVIYREQSMLHLRNTGSLVYLETGYDELRHRITNMKTRGIVMREGQSLLELYNEREMLYGKYAAFRVSTDHRHVEDIVDEIIRLAKTASL